ncbi:MAG: hypothetical protein AXA67_07910 [Methylothermaceae bacteria B42]|nr:MAG: hypothetical protein AXA67_07910 [Methylothermaceae bacteria B42]HHJ37902.1 hypothetical protein [Methylothermaceae bacterium]
MKNLLFLITVLLLISGCAANLSKKEQYSEETPSDAALSKDYGWWYAAFRFEWPANSAPLWHRDVMVAHRIILPVLKQYRPQIKYWRVHRRAGRDGGGHRFSFIFYATPQTAQAIYAQIETDPDLMAWRQKGMITQIHFDDFRQILKPDIEDTSDPSWPAIIQQTWPLYIQGVSEMWLALVEKLAEEFALDTLAEKPYRQVQHHLTLLWAHNARHAFLHHLNAIYAYETFWASY